MWRRVFQGRPCVRCVRCHAAKVHKDENTWWQNKAVISIRIADFPQWKTTLRGNNQKCERPRIEEIVSRSIGRDSGISLNRKRSFHLEMNVSMEILWKDATRRSLCQVEKCSVLA